MRDSRWHARWLNEKERKLPVWVQDELAYAREQGDKARKALQEYKTTLEKSDVYYGYEHVVYLPQHESIHFRIGPTERVFDYVSVRRVDGNGHLPTHIEVSNAGGPMLISPTASNVVRIMNADFRG